MVESIIAPFISASNYLCVNLLHQCSHRKIKQKMTQFSTQYGKKILIMHIVICVLAEKKTHFRFLLLISMVFIFRVQCFRIDEYLFLKVVFKYFNKI